MNATTPTPSIVPDNLDLLRTDLRDGRSFVVTFQGPRGISAVEVMGPKGMRQDGGFLSSPVRTVRLWVAGQPFAPEAVVRADEDLVAGLLAIEERARLHIHAEELADLSALLDAIRASVLSRKPRVPKVTLRIHQKGVPCFRNWASCLTLGDLETALLSALRPSDPALNAKAA